MTSGVRLHLLAMVMLLAVGGCALPIGDRPLVASGVTSYAAVDGDVTGSIGPPARRAELPEPARPARKHVYLLLGGLQGVDGWVTSAGMFGLRWSLAALPNVKITT